MARQGTTDLVGGPENTPWFIRRNKDATIAMYENARGGKRTVAGKSLRMAKTLEQDLGLLLKNAGGKFWLFRVLGFCFFSF